MNIQQIEASTLSLTDTHSVMCSIIDCTPAECGLADFLEPNVTRWDRNIVTCASISSALVALRTRIIGVLDQLEENSVVMTLEQNEVL